MPMRYISLSMLIYTTFTSCSDFQKFSSDIFMYKTIAYYHIGDAENKNANDKNFHCETCGKDFNKLEEHSKAHHPKTLSPTKAPQRIKRQHFTKNIGPLFSSQTTSYLPRTSQASSTECTQNTVTNKHNLLFSVEEYDYGNMYRCKKCEKLYTAYSNHNCFKTKTKKTQNIHLTKKIILPTNSSENQTLKYQCLLCSLLFSNDFIRKHQKECHPTFTTYTQLDETNIFICDTLGCDDPLHESAKSVEEHIQHSHVSLTQFFTAKV